VRGYEKVGINKTSQSQYVWAMDSTADQSDSEVIYGEHCVDKNCGSFSIDHQRWESKNLEADAAEVPETDE